MGCSRIEIGPLVGRGLSVALGLIFALSLSGCSRYVLTRADLGVLDASQAPAPVLHRDDIRFVVFGDSRSRGALDYLADSALRTCRSRLTKAVASEDVDFVINTGDMVKNGRKELWDYFEEDTRELIKPRFFFTALGNHEYKNDPGDLLHYFALFGPIIGKLRSYAFAYGDAYVIVLDSFAVPRPVFQEDGEDNIHALWLREQLEESARDSRVVIVALHHPVFSSGSNLVTHALAAPVGRLFGQQPRGHSPPGWTSHLREDLVAELVRRKERLPGARTLVFTGHSHFYEHYRYGGVDFTVTGGGGAPPNRTADEMEYRLAAHEGAHYVRVTLSADDVEMELVPVECELR